MNTNTPTAEEFIADLSDENGIRDYLGDFANDYDEDAISDIASTYRAALEPRKGEIADALAGLSEGEPVTTVTDRLKLTEALDSAIQAHDAE